jgi:hypothetical protein
MKEDPHFLFSKVVFSTQYADFKEHLITRVADQGGQVRVFRALAQPENGKFTALVLRWNPLVLVGLTGLEPVTLRLSSACSNQLSYRPDCANIRRAKPRVELSPGLNEAIDPLSIRIWR